jgi:uncharacterized protein (TIGR00369 family)
VTAEAPPPPAELRARLAKALERIGAAVARGDVPPAGLDASVQAAEEIASRLEEWAPGSLWGWVSGSRDSTARALFALGLIRPLEADARAGDGRAEATVTFDERHEGPLTSAHGGIIAALFDDVSAIAASSVAGPDGLTSRLEVRYHRPAPLGVPLTVRAAAALDGRSVSVHATLRDASTLYAESRAEFITPRKA